MNGNILPCARLERQADDVRCPRHQLPKTLVCRHRCASVGGNRQPEDGVALRRRGRGYTFGRVFLVESEGAGATEELRRIRDAEDGFEAQSEPPDLAGISLGRHVREHERFDAPFVDRLTVVGAVEILLGQSNQNTLSAICLGKRVRAVLDEFEELPMCVSAMRRVVFVVRMFGDEIWLHTVGLKGLFGLHGDEVAKRCSEARPVGQFVVAREVKRSAGAVEPAPFGVGEVVFTLHGSDSN